MFNASFFPRLRKHHFFQPLLLKSIGASLLLVRLRLHLGFIFAVYPFTTDSKISISG